MTSLPGAFTASAKCRCGTGARTVSVTLGDFLRVAATDCGDPDNGYQSGQQACGILLALMGDPTLRICTQPTPVGLTATPGMGMVTPARSAPVAPGITGYWIDRAIGPTGSFLPLNRTPITGTQFVDTGLSRGQSARYRVLTLVRVNHPGGTLLVPGQGAMATTTMVSASVAPRLVISSGGETALSEDAPPKSESRFFLDGADCLRLTLSNRGSRVLQLEGPPLLTGPAASSYSITTHPPLTIAAGTTAETEVAFTPGASTSSEAVPELTSNDPVHPVKEVTLAGAGVPDAPVFLPALPTINLPSNGQGTASVFLQNPGPYPIDYVIESPFPGARIVSSTEAGGPPHE